MTSERIDADYPSRWFDLVELLDTTICEAVLFRRECRSTNDLAHEAGPAAGGPLLVLADDQTGGRGRGSNQWWARTGALTFSLRLNPGLFTIPRSRWPLVSLATAIAVADGLAEFAPDCEVGLKWPNDVHLRGRKVCGILVEPVRPQPDEMVIGVGVNVLNSLADAPAELHSIATSIVDQTGTEHSPGTFLIRLLAILDARLRELGRDELPIVQRWSDQCVLENRFITLESGDRTVSGICRGIDSAGAIQVETDGVLNSWFGGIVRPAES